MDFLSTNGAAAWPTGSPAEKRVKLERVGGEGRGKTKAAPGIRRVSEKHDTRSDKSFYIFLAFDGDDYLFTPRSRFNSLLVNSSAASSWCKERKNTQDLYCVHVRRGEMDVK